MPDRLRASQSTGGKFDGTLKMVASTPASGSSSQKAVPWRRLRTWPEPRGTFQGPSFQDFSGPVASLAEKRGSIVTGSRWMKSKMPWPPGSRPVMKFDQATGDCGGIEVPNGVSVAPCARKRAKFGSAPSSRYCRSSCGSMPSKPRITTRGPSRDDARAWPATPAASPTSASPSSSAAPRLLMPPCPYRRPRHRGRRCRPWRRCSGRSCAPASAARAGPAPSAPGRRAPAAPRRTARC